MRKLKKLEVEKLPEIPKDFKPQVAFILRGRYKGRKVSLYYFSLAVKIAMGRIELEDGWWMFKFEDIART